MIPIFEQGEGKGIGHGLDSFLRRFDDICKEHIRDGRAKAFAFVFYDFTDRETRKILHDQGVFAKLDRLSGNQLSLFYLHAGTRYAIERFNESLMAALGVSEKAETPCVVFFKVSDSRIEEISVVQLEQQDLIHGFGELYEVVQEYILGEQRRMKYAPRAVKWLKTSAKFIGVEIFRAALKKTLEGW